MNLSQLLQLPNDPAIPALAPFVRHGVAPLLARAGVEGPFDGAEVVKYVAGSRLIMRVNGATGPIAIKAYRKNPSKIIAALKLLESEGFAGGRGPTAAPLLGFDRSLKFTVHTWFEARSGWDLMLAGQGERAGEIAAHWLVATHGVRGTIGKEYAPENVLGCAVRWAATVSAVQPELKGVVNDFIDRLSRFMPKEGIQSLRHGAFGPKHVFDLERGPGVIDWDSPKCGAAEVDCATFLAKLSNDSIHSPHLAEIAHQTAMSFRAGIASIVDARDLAWYEAVSCLKCATYASRTHGQLSTGPKAALLERATAALGERR